MQPRLIMRVNGTLLLCACISTLMTYDVGAIDKSYELKRTFEDEYKHTGPLRN